MVRVKGSHVSVFIELMRGEFDRELNWPFQGSITVTVTLLDQEGENMAGYTHQILYIISLNFYSRKRP